MLFSPWLSTFRNKARRRAASALRKSSRREKRLDFPGPSEVLEPRTLLTGPTFVSVSPNFGEFLQDGDLRNEVPEELLFQFSLGESIDTNTLDAVQVYGAGHDGGFRPASTITDFGTTGQVVVRLGTQSVSPDENGSVLTIQSADNGGAGPTITNSAAANEIQQLSLSSDISGGTFQLRFGGFFNTTADIPFDADAATVRTALVALSNVNPGDVLVTGGPLPGAAIDVQFRGQYARTNVAQMTLLGGSLTNNEEQSIALTGTPLAGDFTLSLNDAANGISGNSLTLDFDSLAQNERQFISLTGAPTGGNFTLDFNDAGSGINGTTNNIAFNANVAAVQTAIEGGIPALAGNIQVSGGPLAGQVTIQFIGTLAATNVAAFTLNNNGLTGGATPGVTLRSSNSVLTALENITGLPGNIQVTGTSLAGTVLVEFTSNLADTDVGPLTVNSSTLIGATVDLQTRVEGDQSGTVTTTQTGQTNGLTLTLDTNVTNPTTTDLLLDFLANDPLAGELLSAEVLSGDSTINISGGAPQVRTLSGAGAAEVISDLDTGTDLRVQIIADSPGLDGNRIFVQLNRLDLGTVSSAPQITVSGHRIEVVLNENAAAPTTAQDLVDALNSGAADALVNASIAVGTGTTDISGVQDGTVLQLSGADTVVDAGHRGIAVAPNEVIYRFAETLSDDLYRIEVHGRGAQPLLDTDGERFEDGANHFQNFTLNLGAQVRAVVPQPVMRQQILTVVDPTILNDGDTITIDPGPLSTVAGGLFVFELTDVDVDAGNVVRTGNIPVSFSSSGDSASVVAMQIADAISTATVASVDIDADWADGDDFVTITGGAFDARVTITAQNAAALEVEAGGLTQRRNLVNVTFSDDELDPGLATDAQFYRLFDSNETLTLEDDTRLLASNVYYSSVDNTAVLDFGSDIPTATYRLLIGTSNELNDLDTDAINVGSVFATQDVTQVGFIGDVNGDADVDLYRVTDVPAGDTLTVDVTPDAGFDAVIRILRADGTTAVGATADLFFEGGAESKSESVPGTEDYFVEISGFFGSTGSYQLRIGTSTAVFTGVAAVDDDNSSFAASTQLGTLGDGTMSFFSQIEPQSIVPPPPTGDGTEPGHREIPAESHLNSSAFTDTVRFSFPVIYGQDAQLNDLINQVSPAQQTRAREIFEMYGSLYGFEVQEVTTSNVTDSAPDIIHVVTGDVRVLLPPGANPSSVAGINGFDGNGQRIAIMNGLQNFTAQDDLFSAGWMDIALHEIGHAIGLGHSYELRSSQGDPIYGTGSAGDGSNPFGEDFFPGHEDIVHGRVLHPNVGTDIDVYQFEVDTSGTLSAEIVAERFDQTAAYGGLSSSLLNSALRLYRDNGDGTRTLVAQNDDYFSNDAFISLDLEVGTYFIGVSSTGNTDYDPRFDDTGFNGTSEGDYQLNLTFDTARSGSLLDDTGERFDGDSDGKAGGTFEFDFRSDNTLLVDKTIISNLQLAVDNAFNILRVDDISVFPETTGFQIQIDNEIMTVTAIDTLQSRFTVLRGQNATTATSHAINAPIRPAGADGSETNPFGIVSAAVAAAGGGDIIRLVGNGGADNDILTIDDNRPYLLGLDDSLLPLEDGSKFEIPQDVIVQIDAGVAVKVLNANIDAGTSALGIDRSGGALQVLGTPHQAVFFTTYENDLIGGDSDGATDGANPGDWGGLVLREDSDFQAADAAANPMAPGIFLNYINQADIHYGGGKVTVDSVESVFAPIHLITSRPTVTYNTIADSAAAALSADPDSFDESRGRIGPDFTGNTVVDNTLNGVFLRIDTQLGQPIDRLTVGARFDDTDLVHIITENLEIVGNPGGPLDGLPRLSGRLAVDPGVVVKMGGSRIEALRGNSSFLAEGTDANPVIITSIHDDRYGAAGSFDSTGNGQSVVASPGDWGGLIFNANSRVSIADALVAYGGGEIPIAGGFGTFNAIELHHGVKARIVESNIENHGAGGGADRNGRGVTTETTIFVRQSQPILLNNVIQNNDATPIDINANALVSTVQRDSGRSIGALEDYPSYVDNRGPLIRENRIDGNLFNGLEVRAEILSTESVWDDTDIVHVVRDEIVVDRHHTFSGLRLQSAVDESLVVKFENPIAGVAGITADGFYQDIDDRVGGTVQVIGRPGHPVVMTALKDSSVGAGLTPDGIVQLFTDPSTRPTGQPTTAIVDIILLLDDTSSFQTAGDTVLTVFPQVVAALQAALPGSDLAFGVARYEEYTGPTAPGGATTVQPFILNQPVIALTNPDFQAAFDAALARQAPGGGSGRDETHIEALFQVATGQGFDGNGDSDITDAGPAGLFTTQINNNTGGDIPDFASFMPDLTGDPNGPIIPSDGTVGGVGFRATATERIVLLATDGLFNFEADGQTTYTGVGGVTVPSTAFTDNGSTGTPNGLGASIQNTVDALIAENIKVIGLGDNPAFGSGTVQEPLEALATLTGAVDGLGNPLYFDVEPDNANEISTAIVSAVTGAVTSVTAGPGDWRGLRFTGESNDRNVRVELEDEFAHFRGNEENNTPANAQFLGELAPQHITGPNSGDLSAIDTIARADGDDNRPEGFEVHGFIGIDTPGDVDIYSFNATAGNEVWIDLDRTRGGSLDPVVELIQADGTLIARTRYDHGIQMVDFVMGTATPTPLTEIPGLGGDSYSTNPYDTGFRVVLPGPVGALTTYFVRLRSNQASNLELDDINRLDQGVTGGEYQLQIRTQQVDEKPGSTVRYAEIRLASTGIEVIGLPSHSPLMGESLETTADNNTRAEAQQLGNLLKSDRNVFSTGGTLGTGTDVDFFQYSSDYAEHDLDRDGVDETPSIQSIAGLSAPAGATWSTVFDVDYADGLTRGDTTLIVYDGDGVPILIGRESDIEDDRRFSGTSNDLDDLSRGSVGFLDPFIGPVQMPTGGAGGTTNYFYAVSSNSQLNNQLDQTFAPGATNADVRLEPVTSVTRIVEDHIGFQGYTSYVDAIGNPNVVLPAETDGLFNITSSTELSATVREFDLADVPLFIATSSGNDRLYAYDVLNGQQVQLINNDATATNVDIQDLVMRSDGTLFGFRRDTMVTSGDDLVTVDPVTGTLSQVGLASTNGREVGAITYVRSNPATWTGYYSLFNNAAGADNTSPAFDDLRSTVLHSFNGAGGPASTGSVIVQDVTLMQADAIITVLDDDADTADILLTTIAPGPAGRGNGITITTSSGGANANVVITVGALNDSIDIVAGTQATAQNIIDAINNDVAASALVNATLDSGDAAAVADGAPAISPANQVTANGVGNPISGNITGLSSDRFSNGTLYGITNRGEVLAINPANGNAVVAYDFRADGLADFGIANTEANVDFRGLALAPQNLHDGLFGTGGALEGTMFTINRQGQVVAFRPDGFGGIEPVLAFGSDNEVQTLTASAAPQAGDTFTLTFDSALFGPMTTRAIDATDPTDISDALQELHPLDRLGNAINSVTVFAAADLNVSGSLATNDLEIEFQGFYEDKAVNLLTVDDAGMGGGRTVASAIAIDGSGNPLQGGDGIRTSAVQATGRTNATGLAFSNLDFNLWHPTTARSGNDGHGINTPYDATRDPANEDASFTDPADNNYTLNEQQGGTSFYFGLENYSNGNTPYLNFDRSNAQYGVFNNAVQQDLTSSGSIGNNYNLAGGALGALVTQPFDLISDTGTQSEHDRPTLYFNYFLDSENDEAGDANGTFNDSARVFLSDDGGRSWVLVATNNSPRDDDSELPDFNSHSRQANVGDPRQAVQELFDADDWRQVRVDLSDFVGMSGLQLRFDFSTAGTIVQGGFATNDGDLATDVDGFGRLTNTLANGYTRAADNNHEGFYIDDIIIGWSERGEMITGAVAGDTYFEVPQPPASLMLPQEILIGDYQVEVRRGFEYAATPNPSSTDVTVQHTFDPNIRFIPGRTFVAFPQTVADTDPVNLDLNIRGDRNVERQQGHLQIENNIIRDAATIAIDVKAAPRALVGGLSTYGSPINFDQNNVQQLAPGITIANNLITGFGTVGIQFGGDPDFAGTDALPASAVPFGKIINNTIFGADSQAYSTALQNGTGVLLQNNASPTLLNNLIVNTTLGIDDQVAGSVSPVVNRTFFHNNTAEGTTGQNAIIDAITNPLFIDVGRRNFYLADGAQAVDRSLGSLPDRTLYVAVKAQSGIPNSDVVSPDRDLFGQRRVDDFTQLPSGLGGEVFNDLGAIERADFEGGVTVLIVPEDGGPDDKSSITNVVHIDNPVFFNEIVLEFVDDGIGIDDSTVNTSGGQFTITQTTKSGTRTLQNQVDYQFVYLANSNHAIFTSLTTFDTTASYHITVDNSVSTGILDFALNPLVENQPDGSVAFDIIATDGINDPPVNTAPATEQVDENDTAAGFPTSLTLSAANGNGISVDDVDAFLGTNQLEITLSVSMLSGGFDGTLTLPAGFGTLVTLDTVVGVDGGIDGMVNGIDDTTIRITGTIPNLNTVIDGLIFRPAEMYPGLSIVTPVSTVDAEITISTSDLGNFNLPTDPAAVTVDVIQIDIIPAITAPNSFDIASTNDPLVVSEDGTTTDTFTVVLDRQPLAGDIVVFTVTADDATEASVDVTTMTFDDANWNTPQTVTVSGVDDDFDDGDIASTITISVDMTMTTDRRFNEPGRAPDQTVDVTTTDDDDAGFTLTPAGPFTVSEDGTTQTAFYDVTLTAQPFPGEQVVLDLTLSDATEVSIDKSTLTFDDANAWNVAQRVTITGVDDDLDDGDIMSTITVSVDDAATDQVEFDNVADQVVTVTTTDDDEADFTIDLLGAPANTLTVSEDGTTTTDTFTVVLNARPIPGTQVVLDITPNDTTEVAATASLTFDETDWNMPQTINVTGVNDFLDDGNILSTITVSIDTVNTDAPAFLDPNQADAPASIASQDVDVLTVDDDEADFTVDYLDAAPTGPLTVSEDGTTTDTFTVVLDTQPEPGSQVVLTLTANDSTEASVASPLMFDETNWSMPQTVTVTGVDDFFDDGDIASTITVAVDLGNTTSPTYLDPNQGDAPAAVAPQNVNVVTTDDDEADFTIDLLDAAPAGPLVVSEDGTTITDTFTVVLDAQPIPGTVVVLSIVPSVPSDISTPASIMFDDTDWNISQTVTVTGVDDLFDDGDFASIITVSVFNADTTAPAYLNPNQAAAPAAVAPQTIDVVSINDDDEAGFAIDLLGATGNTLTVSEDGTTTTDTFTVVLDVPPIPGTQVVLSVTPNDPTEVSSTMSLTFDVNDWNIPKTVNVTGVDDFLDDGDILSTITVSIDTVNTDAPAFLNPNQADAPAFVAPQNVDVLTIDDDEAGFTIDLLDVAPVGPLTVSEDGTTTTDTFTVVLNARPIPGTQAVLSITPNDTTEVAATMSLTFDETDWDMPQTVNVTGVDDFFDDGGILSTITVSIDTVNTDAPAFLDPNQADAPASVVPRDVNVVTVDDDEADFTIDLLGAPGNTLTVSEDGTTTTDTFTVVLNASPIPGTQAVVSITPNDMTEVAATMSLTFDETDWNIPQTVNVTGVDDFLDEGDVLSTITVSIDTVNTDAPAFLDPNQADAPASVASQNVDVLTTDDDEADFTIDLLGAPSNTLTVSEDGITTTDTFTVVLNARPIPGTQAILSITPNDATEVAATMSLTFDETDWNTPQTVTVTGVDDSLDDGDILSTITVAIDTVNTDAPAFLDPNQADAPASIASQNVDVLTVDDDEADFTIDLLGASGNTLTVSEDGTTTTDTFTVALDAQPEPGTQVSLTLTANDATEATVTPSLMFDETNWNMPQTVTVVGVNDFFDDGDIASTITVAIDLGNTTSPTYVDPNQGDAPAAVAPQTVDVVTTDDDSAGVLINELNGVSVTESGSSDTFLISLDAQPLPGSIVVVTITSGDTGEATVTPASVQFDTNDWSTQQTITVNGVDDLFDDGDIVSQVTVAVNDSLTTDPAFQDPAKTPDQPVNVTTTDDDTADFTVDLLDAAPAGSLTVSENGTVGDTFTVVLDARPIPGTQVVFSITPDDPSEVSATPSLTFDASNWSTPQTVTVAGVDDLFDDGDIVSTVTIAIDTVNTDAPAFLDPEQGDPPATIASQSVNVSTTDDDHAGFTIDLLDAAPSDPLVVSEDGTQTDSFTVVLDAQPLPGTQVTFSVSPSDVSEGQTSTPTLTFDSTDWSTPKTVLVSGVDDPFVDGNISANFLVSIASAMTTDPAFNDPAKTPMQTVAFTNVDDEVAEFDIVEEGGFSLVAESGTTDTFTVVLRDQPLTNVVLSVTSTDTGEVSVDKPVLTFTPADWNVPQTVTVTGEDEFTVDGDQTIPVRVAVLPAGSHSQFHAVPAKDVNVTVTDDDLPSFTVTLAMDGPFPGTTVSENRTADTLSVVLDAQPVTDVVLTIMLSDPTEATLNATQIRFTSADWDQPRQIVVTGVDDFIVDGPQISVLTVSINTDLTDDFWDGLAAQTFDVTTLDNENGQFLVSNITGFTVSESGTSQTFQVVLGGQPMTDVVLNIVTSDTTETSVDKATLTFTSSDWFTRQTVTITGIDDNIVDGTRTSIITVSVDAANSNDGFDSALPTDLTISTTDNDIAGFTVTESNGSTSVRESGTTDSFTVVLDAEPLTNVVFRVNESDSQEATVDVNTLTFTPADWDQAQTVTVTGVDDSFVDGDATSTITIAVDDLASAIAFRDLPDATVLVETLDDGIPSFTISESNGTSEVSESGSTDTFTVVLDAQPQAAVVLTVANDAPGEVSAVPTTLTFNPQNWNSPQTVTLTGQDDVIVNGDRSVDMTVSVDEAQSDAGYHGVSNQIVSVLIADDDVAGFTINAPVDGLKVISTGTTDTFTVVLLAQPLSDVVLDVSSGDSSDASVSASQLTFNSGNWNSPQTVTVTGLDDMVDDGDQMSQITVAVNVAASDTLFSAVGSQTTPVTIFDNAGIDLTVSLQGATDLTVGTDGTGNVALILGGDGVANVTASINGIPTPGPFLASGIKQLTVIGSGDGNTIDLSGVTAAEFSFITGVGVDVNAGGGNDVIVGSSFDDVIIGSSGNDVINSGDGDDVVFGGSGKDVLNGGAGNDELFGQGSTGDSLTGGTGDDLLDGGSGNDVLVEFVTADLTLTNTAMDGLGNDIVISIERARLQGNDDPNRIDVSEFFTPRLTSVVLFGGNGDDALIGSPGNDVLRGEGGSDNIVAGDGNDRGFGGSDADTLSGGAGDDLLFGQGGSGDWLIGGQGFDQLNGGRGIDRVVASADVDFVLTNATLDGVGLDTLIAIESAGLTGGPSDNVIDASAFSQVFVIASGGGGNDTLIGGDTFNVLNGGAGNDNVIGGPQGDVLRGDGGNDSIVGGDGDDVLEGGDDNDTLLGQNGADTIDGGRGADGLSGAAGDDMLNGWKGSDLILGGQGQDLLEGFDGSDILIGGTGLDTLLGQVGSDTLVRGDGTTAEPADSVDDISEVDDFFTLNPVPAWIDEI